VEFRALGPLEVLDDTGRPVDLGGAQPRKLMAALLAAEDHVVAVDALVEAVWRGDPPPSAAGTLQSYVSRLRRRLGDAAPLVREAVGYRLVTGPDIVDFRRFEVRAGEGRALLDANRLADARSVLADALALWRGAAFADFADVDLVTGPARRLEELRLTALDDRITADLRLGRHSLVIGELRELVGAHPLRESLWAHLALALYRSGRQADALRALGDARRTLVDELGVDPGPALRELEGAILRHDPSLDLRLRVAIPIAHEVEPSGPLVGRTTELAQLWSALDEAGHATRVVIIEGVPGIGKTRLALELAAGAQRRGAAVLWGSAFEGGAAPAYWPWLPPLRSLARARPAGSSIPPVLTSLVDPDGRDSPPAAGLDPGPFALVDAVAELVIERAAAQQLLLVLDDVQWADEASLELLAAVMNRLVDTPLLLVCTAREPTRGGRLVPILAGLSRRPGTRRIHLRGLSEAATAELVEQTTGEAPDHATAAAVHRRAEGNPFFTTEMARLLAAGEGVERVPAGVRDVVRHRVGQLPPATVRLLEVAAVIGRETDVELLARAAEQSVDACLATVEPAVEHQLLVHTADRPGTLQFVHALVREILADDLSPLRRSRLHLRIADVLPTTDDTAEIVAEHVWRAASIAGGRRAADALERAARVAVRRLAYVVADDLLERAIRLRRTTRGADEAPGAELDALLQLVMVRGARHGYHGVVGSPVLARAKQLADQLARTGDLMALLWMEWASSDLARHTERSEAMAAELLARGTASQGAADRVVGHTAFGIARWHRGDFPAAAEHLDEACRLLPDVRTEGAALQQFGADPLRLAAPFAVYVHELVGDVSDADADAGYLAAVNLHRDDPLWELVVMSFGASAATSAGRPERALQWIQRAQAVDPEGVSSYWTAVIEAYQGAALCLSGDLAGGLPLLDDAWSRYRSTGLHTNAATWLASRAHGLAVAGRVDEAAASLADAERELRDHRDEFATSTVRIAEALVLRARGDDPSLVRQAFAEALAIAAAQGAQALARRVRREADACGVELDP
jgi:DNA-binding SARP family transcriptional activator/tetratricopeptide (TPR) repeat protein